MKFTKVQGAGNDFVLFDVQGKEQDWSSLAQAVCDRHFGIGADGMLLLLPSAKADFRMRIFNLDGSEADACGNGLRSLVRYILVNKLPQTGTRKLTIETMAGVREVKVDADGGIQVYMGQPIFEAQAIPASVPANTQPITDYPFTINGMPLQLNIVSMGNPHAVYFINQPVADFPLDRIGPQVEKHAIFPKHVNFEVAQVISPGKIEARVWERGVGETLACGSGACAIGVMAHLKGYGKGKFNITLPGGILNVEWPGKDEVLLGGPAEIVFSGDWQDKP
jgi:diaminopimelate epimerase